MLTEIKTGEERAGKCDVLGGGLLCKSFYLCINIEN